MPIFLGPLACPRPARSGPGAQRCLRFAFDLWERAFHEVGQKDYPDIKRDYAHVDATTMWFVKNPEWFDVIVIKITREKLKSLAAGKMSFSTSQVGDPVAGAL